MAAKDKNRQKLGQSRTKLPVPLTDPELLDRAKRIGEVFNELHRHLVDADDVKKELKKKENELELERIKLAHMLHTGAENREVVVEAWADFSTGTFTEVRKDTGEVITKRDLEPEERQGQFDAEEWGESLFSRLEPQLARDDEGKGGEAA